MRGCACSRTAARPGIPQPVPGAAEQLGVPGCTTFEGRVDNIRDAYVAGMSLCSPACRRLPIPVIEAMTCGRPLRGTDVGGGRSGGRDRCRSPPRDPEAMADSGVSGWWRTPAATDSEPLPATVLTYFTVTRHSARSVSCTARSPPDDRPGSDHVGSRSVSAGTNREAGQIEARRGTAVLQRRPVSCRSAELCERFESCVAPARGPLEIAAGLEAEGFSDQTVGSVATSDVFDLAEYMYRRVPRSPASRSRNPIRGAPRCGCTRYADLFGCRHLLSVLPPMLSMWTRFCCWWCRPWLMSLSQDCRTWVSRLGNADRDVRADCCASGWAGRCCCCCRAGLAATLVGGMFWPPARAGWHLPARRHVPAGRRAELWLLGHVHREILASTGFLLSRAQAGLRTSACRAGRFTPAHVVLACRTSWPVPAWCPSPVVGRMRARLPSAVRRAGRRPAGFADGNPAGRSRIRGTATP